MKRSNSAPCLADGEEKRLKVDDGPDTREYLQLALARVLQLQRAVRDNTYFDDNTSDLDESDTEEDTMREVLTKVFKDLPGSASTVSSLIERATRPPPAELQRIRAKSIQLTGYDTCRRVTLDFMKNIVKHTPKPDDDVTLNDNASIRSSTRNRKRRETICMDYDIRSRMLKSLDLHLAVKQRDYTYKLMRL